jgi:hypothetical protein
MNQPLFSLFPSRPCRRCSVFLRLLLVLSLSCSLLRFLVGAAMENPLRWTDPQNVDFLERSYPPADWAAYVQVRPQQLQRTLLLEIAAMLVLTLVFRQMPSVATWRLVVVVIIGLLLLNSAALINEVMTPPSTASSRSLDGPYYQPSPLRRRLVPIGVITVLGIWFAAILGEKLYQEETEDVAPPQ